MRIWYMFLYVLCLFDKTYDEIAKKKKKKKKKKKRKYQKCKKMTYS